MSSIGEEFPKEQARVRELLGVYYGLGLVGTFGAIILQDTLRKADAAMASGDVVEIISAYQALKECK